MSTEQLTTDQGKIVSLGRPSDPSSDTAATDKAATTVGASRQEQCFNIVWTPVLNDTWHDTPEDMREATNISRYQYLLLDTSSPFGSRLELDMQGPATNSFYCDDGDYFQIDVWMAGIHDAQMPGKPTITRLCGSK